MVTSLIVFRLKNFCLISYKMLKSDSTLVFDPNLNKTKEIKQVSYVNHKEFCEMKPLLLINMTNHSKDGKCINL